MSARRWGLVQILNVESINAAADSATKRRDYECHVLKTFYLPNGTTPQRLSDIVKMLRTTVQARYIAISSTANAIIMRDTTNRIARAERTAAISEWVFGDAQAATIGEAMTGVRLPLLPEA